jgi:hypothetical protein
MAWYPGARKLELQPESDSQPAIRPTQFIVHSIVAPWDEQRMYEYWRDSTNLESHFGLDYDGSMGQYIGTETRADANYNANRRPDGSGAVSIETASNTSATDPWTPEQTEALIKLGVWLHRAHGIPLRLCRAGDDPGFGYHGMWADWSPGGTACPGARRIEQFREHVFPQIVARATGQDDEMTPDELYNAAWRLDKMTPPDGKATPENPTWAAESVLREAATRAARAEASAIALHGKVDALTALVKALAAK